MNWQWFFPPGLYFVSGVAALAGARTIWLNENRNPGAETLAIMLIFAAEWVFGLAFGTISTSFSAKLFWVKVHFIGVAYTGTIWFIAMNQYIQGTQWLTRRKLILFSIIPTLTILLALTDQYHGLIYKEIFLDQYGPYEITSTTYGIGLWLFLIYNGILVVGGSMMMISTLGQSWWTFRVNGTIMLIGIATPVITLSLQILKPEIFGPLKPTSLAIIFSGITAAFGLESARRQQIASVSRYEIFDTIEDIILVSDSQNRIIDMNRIAEEFFEASLADFIGLSVDGLIPQLREINLTKDNTFRLIFNKQGMQRNYECNQRNMVNWEGKSVNTMYILRDTTKRAEMEQRITTTLEEKETLLKEIHHRAKNNLQVISSIFNLQSKLINNQAMRNAFQESQERIHAIALVHEKLYQSEGVNYIDFADYLHTLIARLLRRVEITVSSIFFDIQVDDISIPYDLATPCGLIAYELISNALKHAFPKNTEGTIQIICQYIHANSLRIKISDSGVGIPNKIDITESITLGFQLINILVFQIKGLLTIDQRSGTSIEIVFPINEDE
ncbi:MAG: PAS domain S-box protein [Anaerolineales bacterium]|nr:PAS domain S-box protein [Chloroflexota bacterium]MBL6981805.1 PAS domain S-box protein [Anaerolineales bacterium]